MANCSQAFDPVSFPQAIGGAEGRHARVGADTRASENDDVAIVGHASVVSATAAVRYGLKADTLATDKRRSPKGAVAFGSAVSH